MSQPPPFSFQMPPATDGAASLGDLRSGSTGDQVRVLQEILAALGLYDGNLDGLFGPKTEAAVRSYQTAVGLPVTGVADAATIASLQAQVPAAGQQAVTTALGPSIAQASGQAQPTLAQRWAQMPLWEKGLIIAGGLAVVAVAFGFAKKGLALSGLTADDVERELSMQRRKCRAILPTSGEFEGGETVDAKSFEVN